MRDDFDEIRSTLAATNRAFSDLNVAEPAGFVHGVLDCGSSDSCTVCDLINRQVANAVMLYLSYYDAEHGPFTLGVVMSGSPLDPPSFRLRLRRSIRSAVERRLRHLRGISRPRDRLSKAGEGPFRVGVV